MVGRDCSVALVMKIFQARTCSGWLLRPPLFESVGGCGLALMRVTSRSHPVRAFCGYILQTDGEHQSQAVNWFATANRIFCFVME